MFETLMAWLRMKITPSPPTSATAALASGRTVAATVRNTSAKMISAAPKPMRTDAPEPVLCPMAANALPVNSTSSAELRSFFSES